MDFILRVIVIGVIIISVIIAIIALTVLKHTYRVPKDTCVLVKEGNAYKKIWYEGLHFNRGEAELLGPYILKEQILPITVRAYLTKDNRNILIGGRIRFQISDAMMYANWYRDPLIDLQEQVVAYLQNFITQTYIAELYRMRGKIERRITDRLSGTNNDWGIRVNYIEIDNLVEDIRRF